MKMEAAKQNFFDRGAVIRAVDAATRKNLSRFGAFVRTRARTSIKKAPKVDRQTGELLGRGRRRRDQKTKDAISQPGMPPFSHEGSYRRLIFFAWDNTAKSVVIGPVLFRRGNVPQLLEYGGVTTQRLASGRTRQATYRPRPAMRLAFAEELRRIPEIWKDSVKAV